MVYVVHIFMNKHVIYTHTINSNYIKTYSVRDSVELLGRHLVRSKLQCFNLCSSHIYCNTITLVLDINNNLECQIMNQDFTVQTIKNSQDPLWINRRDHLSIADATTKGSLTLKRHIYGFLRLFGFTNTIIRFHDR